MLHSVRVSAEIPAKLMSKHSAVSMTNGLLTRNEINTMAKPPRILKSHVTTSDGPRQLGPIGSVAKALAARVMLAAATPEQTLRPIYHQYAGAAALASPDTPAKVTDSPSTFFLPASSPEKSVTDMMRLAAVHFILPVCSVCAAGSARSIVELSEQQLVIRK